MRKVVRGLKNGQAPGATGMKAKHLKEWLDAIQRKEKAVEEDPGHELTLGDKWRVFIELIRTIWDWGEIPEQMSLIVIVLLPKGGGDF